ncbi:MAG: LLM class F420-dependent oxidoreductase [Anaerolineae bacterium]|nr:LLM class F420-dependent oxidoreductase [Anaerolineae bacterium]
MRIGVVFPQIEFPADPIAIRDYAQTAEELGFTHILVYDHVLGANPDRPGGWQGPYTHKDSFYEPFALFSYMAAITGKIELATGIIILPQRQTALVAKQAATLDVLSGGRLRLGIGLGWNPVEYTALNEDFHSRGRRIEEQVEVMRRLWTKPLVAFEGQWHTILDAGVNPLPVQRPIPIWFGGSADEALRRMARIGDGWMTNTPTAEEARPALEKLARYLQEAGRSRAGFGLEPRLKYGSGNPDEWATRMRDWEAAGATHMSVNTMGCGFTSAGEHIEAIRKFAEAVDMR